MSRQETVNTFTDGLVMDLNPITTPNSVLTNALNATLITYNGNEFVLQNDMGNGRVETAYLPAGYVPVGIKEYGGIIYVASYNPLTNKGQIGSFPSPERNISSNEISQAKDPIISPSSFGDLTTAGSQFAVKLQLFPDDVIIRSGDKFSILLKSESDLILLRKFVSNCLNTSGEKVTSPKNKLLTLTVAVLDSNNNFRDITDKLKRFNEDNEEITFDIADSEVLKLNSGFFTQTFEGDPTDIDEYRQQRAVNTYNNKVFGELYLIATLNTISSIDVEVEGYVNKDGTPIKVSDDVTLNEKGTALIFTLNYKYNCPDGVYDEEYSEMYNQAPTEFKDSYATYYGRQEEFNPSQTIHGAALSTTGVDSSVYKIPFEVEKEKKDTYPIYNTDLKVYSKEQSAYLFLSDTTGVLNYAVTPCMKYAPLSGLTVTGSVNLSKLGTGSIEINNWRYYKNPNSMTLTWGLEAYPLTGTYIDNVSIEFFDISNGSTSPVKTLIPSKKRSYNGVFTETIQFDGVLESRKLYLSRITCTIKKLIGVETETRLLGYRWMFTTDLYNNLYFRNIYDFYNFEETQLNEYNKVNLNIGASHTSSKSEPEISVKGALSSKTEPENERKVFDFKKASKTTVSCTLDSSSEISNPDHYPFTLNESGLTTTYDLGSDTGELTLGDIKFYGQKSSYPNADIDDPKNIVNRYSEQSIDSNTQYNKHQFYVTHSKNSKSLSITASLLSQITGNSVLRDILIAHPFLPFVDSSEERFTSVFGFSPEAEGTSSFARRFFAIAAAAKERSGHGDEHWIRLWNLSKPGINQDMNPISSDRTELLSEKKQHGDSAKTFFVKDVWDEYSSLISDTIGKVPIVILQGATMNSGNNGFDNDYYNRCDLFIGSFSKHYTRYQMLLWNTGSKYVLAKNFLSYNSSKGTELPQAIVNTYKDIYIYSESSSVVQMYIMSPENYTYNDDYTAMISCVVKVGKSGRNELLTVNNTPFNSLMETSVTKIIDSDELFQDTELKNSTKSRLIALATFTLEGGSIDHVITEEVKATGMQSEYISNNSMITSGYSLAIVTDSQIFDRDANGQPLSASVMYYVTRDSARNASNVSEISKYVSNLKVDKLNGKTTLLAKGTTGTISKNVYQEEVKSGDSATYVKWGGLPIIDIQYKIPSGATSISL